MSKRFGNFQLKQPSAAYKKARLDIEVISSQQYTQQQQQQHSRPPAIKTPTTVAKSSSKTDYLWGDEDDEFIILASQAVEEVEMFQQSQSTDFSFGKFSKEPVPSSTQATINGQVGQCSSELMPPPAALVSAPSRVAQIPAVIDLLTDDDDDVFSEQFDENYDNIEKHIDEFFNEFDDDFNLDEFRQSGGSSREKSVEQQQRNGLRKSQEKFTDHQQKIGLRTSQERKPPESIVVNGTGEPKPSSSVFRPKQPQTAGTIRPVVEDPVAKGRIFPSQQQQQTQVDREALKNAAKKKDHAKDIQVKFLTGQLEMASKKTEKLQMDYNEVLERIQVRDGEVSMLRYELKNVKSHNDQLRLEKMKESETMKKEWIEKMKDLEKVIVAQKADLEFKNLEMMNLKSKRMSNSFRADKVGSHEKPVTEQDFKAHNRRLDIFGSASECHYEINAKIFELSAESISKFNINSRISSFSKGDALLSQHLGHLQACLSQMVCLKGSLPNDSILSITLTAKQAIREIQKYCNRLQLVRVKDSHLGAKIAFDFLCKNNKKYRLEGAANIYQREAISFNEKAIIQRRFLAALGLLCRYLPELAVRLVRRHEGKENCVSVLSKALNKISYANDLYDHFGMVAASASVLCGLSYHVCLLEGRGPQVMNLLKTIVNCRPDSAYTLTYLSECLFRISSSDESIDLLNYLCWRCKSDCFATNDAFKMIQFTKESCTLQVYAVLLETSVPQNRTLSASQICHLVANTRNTIYFLRNSLARPVRWIRHFFQHSEHSRSSSSYCQCHIKITTAFVVMFHQLLRCWMQCPLNIEFNTMLQITQNGVLLLFDLFQTVYRREILQVGGHAIQCRLQATYNWLVQHQNDFRFQPAHKTALRLLDLRLVMDEPLKSSDDEDRMDVDSDADSAEQERRDMYDDLYGDFFTSKILHP